MSNKHSEESLTIVAYIKENPNQFSVKEVAEHFNKSTASIYTIKATHDIGDLLKTVKCGQKSNDIISDSSSLKGGQPMRKATKADLDALREHCEQHNLPYGSQRLWWHKTEQFSVSFYDAEKLEEDQNRFEDFIKDIKKRSPKVKKAVLPTNTLAIPANMDIHIGKRCEHIISAYDYTPELAIQQVKEGVASLYAMTKPFGVVSI